MFFTSTWKLSRFLSFCSSASESFSPLLSLLTGEFRLSSMLRLDFLRYFLGNSWFNSCWNCSSSSFKLSSNFLFFSLMSSGTGELDLQVPTRFIYESAEVICRTVSRAPLLLWCFSMPRSSLERVTRSYSFYDPLFLSTGSLSLEADWDLTS